MATQPREPDLLDPPASAEATAPAPAQLSEAHVRELARIWSSPAIGEAINRRAQAYLRHGHTIDDDRDRPLFDLPRKARQYLTDGLEMIATDKGGRADTVEQADRRRRALVKLATAAALLMAAHDALAWASAQDGAA